MQLARVEQIKKFRIIPKELDPEEGDTTPTRKVKRRHIYTLFQDLVEDMYRDDAEARIELETSENNVSESSHFADYKQEDDMRRHRFARPVRCGRLDRLRRWLQPRRRRRTRIRSATSPTFPGPLAGSYTPTWEGFELYIKALNDRGGIDGKKVDVVARRRRPQSRPRRRRGQEADRA